MTSSNGNIFRVTGHLCGEFTGHQWIPHTKASDAELWWCFFYLRLNKRLSKQWWGWWFETPSRPLWRYCNTHGELLWNDLGHHCPCRCTGANSPRVNNHYKVNTHNFNSKYFINSPWAYGPHVHQKNWLAIGLDHGLSGIRRQNIIQTNAESN